MSVPLVRDLPASSLEELARRSRAAGVRVEEEAGEAGPGSGYLIGARIHRGAVYYDPARCCGDTLVHEIAHAMGLARDGLLEDYEDHEGEGVPEEVDPDELTRVMPLQVALCFGLRGLGVRRALEWMEIVGYTIPTHDDDPARWWADVGRRAAEALEAPWPWGRAEGKGR